MTLSRFLFTNNNETSRLVFLCSIIVSVAFLKAKHVILHISCVKVSITSSCQWVLNEWLRKKNQAIMFLLHPLEDLRRRQDIVVFINKVDLQFICFIWSLHYCSFKFVHQQYISGREISSSVFGTTKRTRLYIILEFVLDICGRLLYCNMISRIWKQHRESNQESWKIWSASQQMHKKVSAWLHW